MARKIKLDPDLLEKARRCAQTAGYASVEEFVSHILEREIDRLLGPDEEDEEIVRRRLEGLGYLG